MPIITTKDEKTHKRVKFYCILHRKSIGSIVDQELGDFVKTIPADELEKIDELIALNDAVNDGH